MADDKKPTKAERRDDARTRRLEEMKRRQRKAAVRKMYSIGLAVLIVAGIAGLVVLSQKGSGKDKAALAALVTSAGCEKEQTPSDLGAGHLDKAKGETATYNSKPPTSGKHLPNWSNTGVLTAPVDTEMQVHNLEHGHVVIQYKDIDDALITKLEAVAKTDATRIITAPYNDMPYKVAITSWGHLVGCNTPNDGVVDAAKAFADQRKGKGPEGDIPGTPNG